MKRALDYISPAVLLILAAVAIAQGSLTAATLSVALAGMAYLISSASRYADRWAKHNHPDKWRRRIHEV